MQDSSSQNKVINSPKLGGYKILTGKTLRNTWGAYRYAYGRLRYRVKCLRGQLIGHVHLPLAKEDHEDIERALDLLDGVADRMIPNWHEKVKPEIQRLNALEPQSRKITFSDGNK